MAEHLDACTVCAAEFAFQESLLREVRAKVRRIKAPAYLAEKVSRALTAGREQPDQ